ncbi:MAG: hypothetical protein ACRDH7_00970 [Actinomycetota bacterium]
MEVYVEAGSKRIFAGAIEWPGWCRSGRDEPDALAALMEAGSRYAAAMRGAVKGFSTPHASTLTVIERLIGDSTNDFGAPSIAPVADGRPVDAAELDVPGQAAADGGLTGCTTTTSSRSWPTR